MSAEADNRHKVPREDDFNRLKWREKVKPENNPKTILLRVEGMDCADCALHLEKAALSVPGVRSAEVSFATGRMRLVAEERERVLPQVEAGRLGRIIRTIHYPFRAYPNNPAARRAMRAQAKCRKAM